MQPGLITGAGWRSHALRTAVIGIAVASPMANADTDADHSTADVRRDRVSSRNLYPVIRGIVFALPLSALLWARMLLAGYHTTCEPVDTMMQPIDDIAAAYCGRIYLHPPLLNLPFDAAHASGPVRIAYMEKCFAE